MKLLFPVFLVLYLSSNALAQNDTSNQNNTSGPLTTQLKLVKVELTPDCGVIAWTTAQKFELLNHGKPFYPKKYIIVLQKCPELLGRNFFVKGRVYEAVLTKAMNDNEAINSHRAENLPTYWCNTIRPSFN